MNEREVVKLLPPREVVQFDPGGTRKLVRLPVFSSTSFHSRLMNTQNKHKKIKGFTKVHNILFYFVYQMCILLLNTVFKQQENH